MEKISENILGIYCGQNGFRLALVLQGMVKECEEKGKTSDTLSLRVLELLQKCNLSINDVNVIVIGVGPGSFTSSRVAVSFVKGICCANPKTKIIPFTTFEYFSFGKKCDTVLVPAFSDFVFVQKGSEQSCIQFSQSFTGTVVANNETFEKWGKGTQVQPNENFVEFIVKKAKDKPVCINELKPVYLRASQAELTREKQNGSKTKVNG